MKLWLEFILRKQIIKLFLKTQEQRGKTINTLTEEIKEIHRSFQKPESEIVVAKKVNDALVKQLSSVERQCWKNAQYFRREYVEVVGIPSLVEHDQLEPTVCRILHQFCTVCTVCTILRLPAGTKLYINDSLCPYYRGLWNEAK